MWIFEGILYVILLLVFIRYDRKKRLWIKTVSQEEKFEHYLSELSATYGKQKNIEEAVAEVEESHTVTLPTEHSYVRIYGAMCAVIREDGDMLSDGYSVFQLWNVDNSAPVRGNDWNLWTYPMAVSAG